MKKNNKINIREYLQEHQRLLFDGAMGTCFASLPGHTDERCELANLTEPELIRSIHQAYLDAGCHAIKTNTFTVSADIAQRQFDTAQDIIQAASRLALDCAESRSKEVYIFADIGPAPEDTMISRAENYQTQADYFLKQGIENFLLETLLTDDGIPEFARYLKAKCPNAFLIISFAVSFDGSTREGFLGQTLYQRTAGLSEVDAVGFNCVSGPHHLLNYIKRLDRSGNPEKLLSVMPNAGYPTVLGRRTVFQGTPEYFGEQLAQIAQSGASIIGGCCGTTPEHIAQAAIKLSELPHRSISQSQTQPSAAIPNTSPKISSDIQPNTQSNSLAEKLNRGQSVIAVELDPPVDDQIGFFFDGVQALRDAGADAVTIADCPIGRPRADSSLLACKIKRELGVEPLPHMTCRDRNLNAIKALLLGLSIEGVHNVLLVTGDPIPTEDRAEVKSVFNFNSRKLARYVQSLNESVLQTPFQIFGALNLNAKNFSIQLKLAQEKEANGVTGFLTQPVLSQEALENLKRAHEILHGKILAGIYPVVSYKNACFLSNEISGMAICDEIIQLYRDQDRDAAEALAVRISTQIAQEVRPYSDGLYLMTPFKRVSLMTKILKNL